MANNSNNKGQYMQTTYDAATLAEGLDTLNIQLNKNSSGYKEKLSNLQALLESMVEYTFGIREIDHIGILPKFDRNKKLTTVLCRAYFDTRGVVDGNIKRKGAGTGGNNTILSMLGGAIAGDGDFEVSDQFKKIFAPLSAYDDNKLHIDSIPRNPNIACVDLDFFAVMTLALNIKADDPYNFTILGAEPIGKGDDFMMSFTKYIDIRPGKRGRRNKGINYGSLDREWAKQNDAYAQSGRSF